MSDRNECTHDHTRTETREHSHCRYIPSTWERADDNDPFETVVVTDVDVICSDCGELLETLCGD